jgi:hypothetical protein
MRPLLLAFFFIFYTSSYADNTTKITNWTKKTLLNTLSISYDDSSSENDQHSIGLTSSAWDSVHDFFEKYQPQLQDKKLKIHPAFLLGPTIVDSGTAANIPFWRINAELMLPEINKKVAFSLIVLAPQSTSKDPYLIHSMTIIPQENP